MDDAADKENPPADLNAAARPPGEDPAAAGGGDVQSPFNKIDLSQLQGFSFGTQWTQDKSGSAGRSDSAERPRREAFRGDAPNRKDRRSFQRPNGGPGMGGDFNRPEGQGGRGRDGADGPGAGARSGDARRPGGDPAGDSYGRRRQQESAPYISPHFAATFYPEDTSFGALVKTIRASSRTIELFEIARTVLAKPDRFTVLVARKSPDDSAPAQQPAPAPAAAKPTLYIAVPDGLPFESEEAAIAHVMQCHLGLFFDKADVEVDPPKGNFQVVNRCSITGELLGPPNYHRYNQTLEQHHAEKIQRMSLQAYRSRIESVREPEVIQQWLEKMKKVTRYSWKPATPVPAAKAAEPAPPDSEAPPAEPAQPASETPPVAPVVEAPPPSFDSIEEARSHLVSAARDRVVRPAATARFHGRALESLPSDEIRHAVAGELDRQRRFPLDTANALRGRLRREHFTIFKKGSKGISYVCAVKRKFRVPGQVFAESIGSLISFIEAHSLIRASELTEKFLGLAIPAPAREGEAPAEPVLTAEQRDKIGRLQGDLRWLVREGYVTEFIDGTLYAPPPVVESRKKEIEAEEQDPENFPEAPPVTGDQQGLAQSPEAAKIDPANPESIGS